MIVPKRRKHDRTYYKKHRQEILAKRKASYKEEKDKQFGKVWRTTPDGKKKLVYLIGKALTMTGVTIHQIYYWENQKILPKCSFTSRERVYTAWQVHLLFLIRQARDEARTKHIKPSLPYIKEKVGKMVKERWNEGI